MSTVLLLARRELASYLNTSWGYAVLFFVLVADGLWFNLLAVTDQPRLSAEVLEMFFFGCGGMAMIAGVLLTMRGLAEERSAGTMVLLQTAPISDAQIVTGKFLGSLGFLTLITALTFYMPALVELNGKVSWGQILSGYLGVILLGSVSLAVGLWGSAIGRNQLLSAILAGFLAGFLVISWYIARHTQPPLADVFGYMAVFDRHFMSFVRGRINTESVVYYISVIFFFLLWATRVLQSRRQS